MDPYVFEQSNGLWYERRGDYYFPCLTAEEATPVGVWGQRHLRFLKQNRRALYLELKTSGRLNAHLADVDRQADAMLDELNLSSGSRGSHLVYDPQGTLPSAKLSEMYRFSVSDKATAGKIQQLTFDASTLESKIEWREQRPIPKV